MTAILQLRNLILEVLDEEIGTYHFSPTNTTPAIWVFPPAVPNNRKVSGLEVIIHGDPDIVQNGMLAGHTVLTEKWRIRLIQQDINKTAHSAVEKLLIYFPRSQAQRIPATDKSPEQVVITLITDHRFKQKSFIH
jgi:hypothetical protein